MDFIIDNWQFILPWVLYLASEIIGMTKWKSNSTIQLILNGLKKLLPKLIPFLISKYKKK